MRKLLVLLLGLVLWGSGALARAAAEAPAQPIAALAVVLNGRDTGEVLDFTPVDGGYEVSVSDLRRLGLIVPKGPARVVLTRVAGLSYQIDDRAQTIALRADREAMRAALIDLHPDATAGAAEVSPGVLVNYDLTATRDSRSGLAGIVDARAFSRFGVIQSTATVSTYGSRFARRLDTTWSYADPRSMRRYAAGDVVSGGLSWTRPVRMLGAQASSDFALRPDLVTFPTPTLKGDAAAASTVDVFVNGEQRYGGQAPAGAFDVASVPVVTGLNQVSMTVTDAAGRRTTQVLPFYASPAMLAHGLGSFSAEAGVLRLGYAGSSDRYAGAAASASGRYGFSDAMTVEGHVEGAKGLAQAGAGSVFTSRFGLVSLTAAASFAGGKAGGWFSAGFEHVTRRLGLSAGVEGAVGPYRDLAAAGGGDAPRARLRLQASWAVDSSSSMNLAVVRTVSQPVEPDVYGPRLLREQTTDALAVGYARTIRPGLNFSASAYANQGSSRGRALFLTITALFGGHAASISAVADGARPIILAQAAKPATGPGDEVEWRVAAQNGAQSQVLAEAGRRTALGDFGAGVNMVGGRVAARATAVGSLAVLDRRLFVSRAVDSSFAVVNAGAPGITVFADNRPIGRTGRDGRLLAPDLRAFQSNTLALEATDVPFDVSLGATVREVRPLDHAGVVVKFAVKAADQALVALVDEAGKPIPVSSVNLDGSADGPEVGYDGELFLPQVKAHNHIPIRTPDGAVCTARFDYTPVKGALARIGPVVCMKAPI